MPAESPDRVLIFDTTLRDGEQSPGISLNTPRSSRSPTSSRAWASTSSRRASRSPRPATSRPSRPSRARSHGPVIAGLARANPADVDRAWEAVRDAERPRIHTFVATSDIHIDHQLQATREDVKGLARASVAQARELLRRRRVLARWTPRAPTSTSPPRSSRSRIDEGATTINIPDTVGYAMPQEYAAFLHEPLRARAGPARRRALGPLPRRPRAGRRQLASPASLAGARQVECAINGIGERAGNASLEEIVMLLHTRQADVGLSTGVDTREIARSSRLRQPPHRLPRAAQQGDRRAQRLRPRVGHPPGRHPQGALDLRDHGRHHGRAGRQPARPRQALRPPRAALGAGGAGLPGRRPGAQHRLQALQGARGQEEAGHRDGPRGARHRRAARGVAAPTRWSGSTSRPPRAGRRTRPSACARPTARSVQGSFTGDGPIDAVFRAINAATGLDARLREFRVDAVTGGQDALGEVAVVVELARTRASASACPACSCASAPPAPARR